MYDFKILKALRKRQGLTQKDVAMKLGMTQGAYQKKECGEMGISVEDIQSLSQFYDVSISEIFGETPINFDTVNLIAKMANEILELNNEIRRLNSLLTTRETDTETDLQSDN